MLSKTILKPKVLLLLIVILATALRLFSLQTMPNGFSGDEAGQGYSAYSILKTGKDEWGETLPLHPRSFGDYKAPLYIYLVIPSLAIFDLSIFSVRLPAAIVGILTVLVAFYLCRELLKREDIALWSAFLLSINPWHIQLSRTASEGGIGVLLLCLGLLTLLKIGKGRYYLILSAVLFGLSLYSYHAFRVFIPALIFSLIILRIIPITKTQLLKFAAIFLVVIIPLFFNTKALLARSSDVGLFSEGTIRGYHDGKGTSLLPYPWERLFENRYLYIGNQFFNNYLLYLNPQFLFTGSRAEENYLNFANFGLLYPTEVVFWVAALIVIISQKLKNKRLLIVWFVLSPVAAALSTGGVNANRAVTMLPLVILISAIGIAYLSQVRWMSKLVFIILLLNLSFFLHHYYFKLPLKPSFSLRNGYQETIGQVLKLQDKYDKVIISRSFTVPHIYVAFFSKFNPVSFQQQSRQWLAYEKEGKRYVDQLGSWSLGKFQFENLDWRSNHSHLDLALIVGGANEFPESVSALYDYKDSKGQIVYRIVEVKNDLKN